jgi:hypothetical protein
MQSSVPGADGQIEKCAIGFVLFGGADSRDGTVTEVDWISPSFDWPLVQWS